MPTKQTLPSNRYDVDVDGIELASFTSISKVSIDLGAAEQRVCGPKGENWLLSYPGYAQYSDITLKVGRVHNAVVLYDWLQSVIDLKYAKACRNATITQLPADTDAGAFSGVRWHVEDAWPVKWEITPSGAGEIALILEVLTLKVTRIWRD